MDGEKVHASAQATSASPSLREEASGVDLYVDPIAQAKVLRKLDFNIAPLMCLAFLCAYLDRSNIGNAAIAGLNTDLYLSGNDYSSE
jgi:hypothetical protein